MTNPADSAAAFRCSLRSLVAAEPLEGTASTVQRFVALETPGPWGVHALHEARLDPLVRTRLLELERLRVRPLLMRRPRGRTRAGTVRLFTAHAPSGRLETADLADPRELLDIDLAGFAAGVGAGLEPHPGPLFLACTHGRHDVCCAELGRPLAAALAKAAPDGTWEVSHIGGDRFAPNVLVLPHGLYYGRLLPAEAERFVETHHSGRLDLEHLRGRSVYPFAVQAAEIHLRRHLDHDDLAPMPLVSRAWEADVTTAVFETHGARWRVRVRTASSEPAALTCRSSTSSAAPSHTVLGIERLSRRTDAPA